MAAKTLTLENITDDSPLRLEVIAPIAFPDGSITGESLRKERKKGNLATEFVAGKEYTTLADIKVMREKCRSQGVDIGK